MVGLLEEDKQACCKSIKVLSRALPDVQPSACLALLALDKKGKTEEVRCPMLALFTLARSSQLPYTYPATSCMYMERHTLKSEQTPRLNAQRVSRKHLLCSAVSTQGSLRRQCQYFVMCNHKCLAIKVF